MDEIWKEIPDSDYSVSSLGRIASRKFRMWRVMKPGICKNGYCKVTVCVGLARRTRSVHTLVAEAFLGPRPTPAHQVNHRNGIKTDNRADNLEWATATANVRHYCDVLGNKAARGEANGSSTLTEANVRKIRARLAAGELQWVIAADYGVRRQCIGKILLGKRWAWLK